MLNEKGRLREAPLPGCQLPVPGSRLPEVRGLEPHGVGRVVLPAVVHQQERVAVREAVEGLCTERPVVHRELLVHVGQAQRQVTTQPVGCRHTGLAPLVVDGVQLRWRRGDGAVGRHRVQPGRVGLGVVVVHAEVELAEELRCLEVHVDRADLLVDLVAPVAARVEEVRVRDRVGRAAGPERPERLVQVARAHVERVARGEVHAEADGRELLAAQAELAVHRSVVIADRTVHVERHAVGGQERHHELRLVTVAVADVGVAHAGLLAVVGEQPGIEALAAALLREVAGAHRDVAVRRPVVADAERILDRRVEDAVGAVDVLANVAHAEGAVAPRRERRVELGRLPVERVRVRLLARCVHQRRVVADLLVVVEDRRLVVHVVRPEARVEPHPVGRTRVEAQQHRRDVGVGVHGGPLQRRHRRDARIDGPGQDLGVARHGRLRHVGDHAALGWQGHRPRGRQRVHRARRPAREATDRGGVAGVGEAQRVVEGQRFRFAVEQRPVVPGLEQRLLVGPLDVRRDVRVPCLDRRRHLEGRRHAEARAPGLVALATRGRQREVDVRAPVELVLAAERGDVALHAQLERRGVLLDDRVERGLPPLDARLERVVDRHLREAVHRVRRAGRVVLLVRNLVVLEPALEAAELLEVGTVALVAVADVVGLRAPQAGVGLVGEPEALEDHAGSQVAVPVEAGFVAFHVGQADTEVDRTQVRVQDRAGLGVGGRRLSDGGLGQERRRRQEGAEQADCKSACRHDRVS